MRTRLTNEIYYLGISLIIAVAVTYLHIMLMAYDESWLPVQDTQSSSGNLITQTITQHELWQHLDVVSATAPAPYQYRLFKVILIEAMLSIGLPFVYSWFGLSVALSTIFFYILLWRLRQHASLPFAISGFAYFAFLTAFFSQTGSFPEMLYTWIVYILALIILERDKLQSSTAGFLLACALIFTGMLNRESVIAVSVAFILYLFYILYRRRLEGYSILSSPGLLLKITILCVVTVIPYLLPRVLYPDAPTYPLNVVDKTILGVIPVSGHVYFNLTSPKILFNILHVFLLPAPFIVRGWPGTTVPNRLFLLTTICVLIPAYFVYGQLSEVRMWSEISLLTMPIFVYGATRWDASQLRDS